MEIEDKNAIKEDEFSLIDLFSHIFKNRKLIGTITIIGTIFSSFIILRKPDIYFGEFQIVLSSEKPKTFQSLASELEGLAGLSGLAGSIGKEDDIKTQVEVLQSPSVLLDIFEFTKSEKILKNERYKKLGFGGWRENFAFTLKKNTSVLNLSYRDEHKDLIIPVLKKVSEAYQKFSGKKRKRQIELGYKFYEDQIQLYREKSLASLTNAQVFGSNNQISLATNVQENENRSPSLQNNLLLTDSEKSVAESSAYIKRIDEQMLYVNSLQGSGEEASVLISLINSLDTKSKEKNKVSLELEKIDSDISLNSTLFTDNDPSIINLKNKKDNLSLTLKKQIISLLKAQRNLANSNLQSSYRPPEVITEYKQLVSESLRDQFTYNQLLNEYRALKLFKAQDVDPWELITKPTLLPFPVEPNRKVLLLFSIFISFLTGFFVTYIQTIMRKNDFQINGVISNEK